MYEKINHRPNEPDKKGQNYVPFQPVRIIYLAWFMLPLLIFNVDSLEAFYYLPYPT
jgi:hypothetical protein